MIVEELKHLKIWIIVEPLLVTPGDFIKFLFNSLFPLILSNLSLPLSLSASNSFILTVFVQVVYCLWSNFFRKDCIELKNLRSKTLKSVPSGGCNFHSNLSATRYSWLLKQWDFPLFYYTYRWLIIKIVQIA